MTIKQQGGIFGRNPSFNDIEAESIETSTLTIPTLTATRVPFAGSGGTLTDDDDLSFDGNVLTVKGSATQQINVRSRAGGFGQAGGINIYGNSTDTTGLLISKSGSGSGAPVARADIINQANSDFRLGSNNTPHMTIKGGGDVQLLTGNLVVTSGKGIDFSATSGTGTSELFDDYEEGTFTASLKVGGTTLYSTTTTRYTKVGRLVYYNIDFTNNSYPGVGANTGNVTVSGLPYAATNTVGRAVVSNVLQVSSPFTANLQDIGTNINETSSEITFYSTTGTTSSTLTHTALSASSSSSTYLRLSGVYTAA